MTEKLDYLKSIGVDAIWLTPIFMARSNHRYDTDDYMHVDPALGGDAAFAALSAAAKAHGIQLILDGVFNHTSSDSLYFDRYHRYPDAARRLRVGVARPSATGTRSRVTAPTTRSSAGSTRFRS